MKIPPLFLAALVLLSPLSAQTTGNPATGSTLSAGAMPAPGIPTEVRSGDALLIWIPRASSDDGFLGEAILKKPDGTTAKRAKPFYVPDDRAWGSDVCVFGVSMEASPGTYRIEIRGLKGGIPYQFVRELTVLSREYISEDISLTSDLTSIRTDPSTKKDEEARAMAEILGRTDPVGVWLDGPFERPVASERRTSYFGDKRRYLYASGGTASTIHTGIDLAARTGTPVTASGRGRVVFASGRIVTGNTVILEHLPGVYTIYMHMDTLAVAQGEIVERGARLGTVGATGLATGPHLHWELRVGGEACDPECPAFWSLFPAVPKEAAAPGSRGVEP